MGEKTSFPCSYWSGVAGIWLMLPQYCMFAEREHNLFFRPTEFESAPYLFRFWLFFCWPLKCLAMFWSFTIFYVGFFFYHLWNVAVRILNFANALLMAIPLSVSTILKSTRFTFLACLHQTLRINLLRIIPEANSLLCVKDKPPQNYMAMAWCSCAFLNTWIVGCCFFCLFWDPV